MDRIIQSHQVNISARDSFTPAIMKTILVPTDFSKIARNAIDYAVEIAKLTKAKLVLFHVYHVPVVPVEIPIVMPIDEVKKETMES